MQEALSIHCHLVTEGMCQTCRMRMKTPPSEFTKYQQRLSFYPLPFSPPPFFFFSPSTLVYYNSSIKEQWLTERPQTTEIYQQSAGRRKKGGLG